MMSAPKCSGSIRAPPRPPPPRPRCDRPPPSPGRRSWATSRRPAGRRGAAPTARRRRAIHPAAAATAWAAPDALELEVFADVVDGLLGPEPPDERQGFVEPRRPLLAVDPEHLLLHGVDHAEAERRQRPPAAEPIERGPRLGQQHRITAGKHLHAGAELELLRAAGCERQAHHRLGRRGCGALGQPQRVEPQPLQPVDEHTEVVSVGRWGESGQADTDANLHGAHRNWTRAAAPERLTFVDGRGAHDQERRRHVPDPRRATDQPAATSPAGRVPDPRRAPIDAALRAGWPITGVVTAGAARRSPWAERVLAQLPSVTHYELAPSLFAQRPSARSRRAHRSRGVDAERPRLHHRRRPVARARPAGESRQPGEPAPLGRRIRCRRRADVGARGGSVRSARRCGPAWGRCSRSRSSKPAGRTRSPRG